MGIIIAGSDCNDCQFCSINDRDVSRIKVHCAARGKEYYYGQCVPCEDKVKLKNVKGENTKWIWGIARYTE